MTLADDNTKLLAENAAFAARIAELEQQLATALARIAELEQQRQDPPPFVKANRPKPNQPKRQRKKRAREHNHARPRQEPTRIQSHALDRCPDCNYHLDGHNLAERSVRPLVSIRKISGGSRSEEATKTRMGLASLFETWSARHLNPFEECYKLVSQPNAMPAKTPLPQV